MMETKLWIALCALLLINLGSAEQDASESDLGHEATPKAPAVPPSSPDPISHAAAAPSLNDSDTNPSSRGSGSLSSNTTTEEETITVAPEQNKENATNIIRPSEAAVPENSGNPTDQSTSQPSVPPSGTPTSHTLPTTTTTTTNTTTHSSHTITDPPTTTPPANTSHHAAPPDSVAPSELATPDQTHSSTSVPTPEPPKHETTTITTIISTQSTSKSSTSSSQEAPNPESTTLSSPQNTSKSDGNPKTSNEAHLTTTINLPSSSSAQTKPHANSPSQLNIGNDTTMVHESPTLDPLLAGLVSAFIITAVIITLLLFLKLRRRDNRPEFRRLQDLPMDDMMEDTPLSMYSY